MVRKESADAQVYESCQLNDMQVEQGRISFIPLLDGMSPNSCETRYGREKGGSSSSFDIASVMVEENGELYTISSAKNVTI